MPICMLGCPPDRSGYCEACVLEHNVGSLMEECVGGLPQSVIKPRNIHVSTSKRLGKIGMRQRRRAFRKSPEEIGS